MTDYYEYTGYDGKKHRYISVDIPMEDKDLVTVIQVIVADRGIAAIEAERWEDAKRYSDMLNGSAEALIKANG